MLNGLFGSRIQRRFGETGIWVTAVLLPWTSAAIAAWAFVTLARSGQEAVMYVRLWGWLHVGWLDADVAFTMDRLSGVMCLVVTFVGSLIHVYSIGYMRGDPGYWRFFAYLNLFMFAMLTLVLADNFLLMFVGWEGVGLCSYLLISFWYRDKEKAVAGMKAFVVNRIGDAGFVLGLFLLFWGIAGTWENPSHVQRPLPDIILGGEGAAGGVVGSASEKLPAPQAALMASIAKGVVHDEGPLPRTSVKFREVERILRDPVRRDAFVSQRWLGLSLVTLSCLFLFLGATGKSAQIPLYVWLPDAMAGPTPVSALIHAATMVTAGVYLVARLHFLFALSPLALTVVATVGAATALFAATIGLFQHDIKKVLAYSTVSQLGFMFVAVGVGAFWVGIFHLVTHAFFKACLFLGSGSVILGCHHEQDMRKMGGLWKLMPVTAFTYLLSCLAIAGFPLFSGFFSKDEILWKVFSTGNLVYHSGGFWLYVIAATAALCTSFYMFRSFFMTFTGKYRGEAHADGHGHDAHATADAKPDAYAAPASTHDSRLTTHDSSHSQPTAHSSQLPHESPASMTVVLAILGALAVVGGFMGVPALLGFLPNWFEHWLEPVFGGSEHFVHWRHYSHSYEWGLMGASVVIAFLGAAVAMWLYHAARNPIPARLLASSNPLLRWVHRLIYNKYYVDEVYGRVFVDGGVALSRGLWWVDARIVDGLVNLAGRIGALCGMLQGWIDRVFVDGLVNLVGDGIVAGGRRLRGVQSGRVQTYVYGIVAGCVMFALLTYAVPW
ncbi:MAG: NADH-quinone oxidoreductase subunit L [Deltaproteobacteria bacterium]|nr:NADH-quinone oxidoreductase subunit L [Deltaproteobacteria bacterium]